MRTSGDIVHEGVIQAIKDGVAFIGFQPVAGCSGCGMKSACGLADSNLKQVEVPVGSEKVFVGQHVRVYMSTSTGYRAVLYSYMIPFVLILVSLLWSTHTGISEPVAGILSLSILVPYYLLLKIWSRYFSRNISFEIMN